ncbi:MAG: hypothetical protein R3F48_04400 [Candidatus Zixiibacteriota bacterium]
MLDVLLSIVFLTLLGFAIINGRNSRLGIAEKPLIYNSVVVQFLLNICFILFLLFTIFLVFYNWKLLAILILIGLIVEPFLIIPLIEKLMALALARILNNSGHYRE